MKTIRTNNMKEYARNGGRQMIVEKKVLKYFMDSSWND